MPPLKCQLQRDATRHSSMVSFVTLIKFKQRVNISGVLYSCPLRKKKKRKRAISKPHPTPPLVSKVLESAVQETEPKYKELKRKWAFFFFFFKLLFPALIPTSPPLNWSPGISDLSVPDLCHLGTSPWPGARPVQAEVHSISAIKAIQGELTLSKGMR